MTYSQSAGALSSGGSGRPCGLKSSRSRQVDRQVLGRTARSRPVGSPCVVQFVQDRERLAPELLPAEEPVAELVVHRLAAQARGRQVGGDLLLELGRGQAVVLAGVDRHAVVR